MRKGLTCLILVQLLNLALTGMPDPAGRPNVLFIAIDDLRTALGCYGDPLVQSPRIDRLAATGRIFTGAYVQQAVCGPSRASLLTGRLPDNIRVWHNRNLFRDTLPDVVTLPQLFKNNGYHTVSLGKIFSGNPLEEDPRSWSEPYVLRREDWKNYFYPESQGDRFKGLSHEMADVPDNGYKDGKLADLALETLCRLKEREQPFFLAVGFFKPHLPFNAPKRYWDLYDPDLFDVDLEPDHVCNAPSEAYHSHRELGGYTDMPGNEYLTADQARVLRHGYYACISYVDTQVGKLLDKLEELELDDNTIIVLWGDHGYALGELNRWCKGTNFELDTRVPLIVRIPGMEHPGTPAGALVEMVDLYPTLAELAGLSPPDGIDGRSFKAVLDNPLHSGRTVVMSQFARPFKNTFPEVMGYSVRCKSYRYGRWINFKTKEVIAEELYDYSDRESVAKREPYLVEVRNVADDPGYAGLVEQSRQQLDALMEERFRPVEGGGSMDR